MKNYNQGDKFICMEDSSLLKKEFLYYYYCQGINSGGKKCYYVTKEIGRSNSNPTISIECKKFEKIFMSMRDYNLKKILE